jgi:hypothetical protein
MTTRTFRELGTGHGSNPVRCTVKLGGTVIFDGTVPTVNSTPAPGTQYNSVLWSWTKDIASQGSEPYEITVTGGMLTLYGSVANYIHINYEHEIPSMVSGGDGTYSAFYAEMTPQGFCADPRANAAINGTPVSLIRTSETLGQWVYTLQDGDVFTCDMRWQPGVDMPEWNSTTSYIAGTVVRDARGVMVMAIRDVEANVPTSTMSSWRTLPLPVWSRWQFYNENDTVRYQGQWYRALKAVPGNIDITNGDYWLDMVDDEGEEYLRSLNP